MIFIYTLKTYVNLIDRIELLFVFFNSIWKKNIIVASHKCKIKFQLYSMYKDC